MASPFLLLWLGQLISNLGTQVSLFSLGLWLFQRDAVLWNFAAVAIVVQLAKLAALPLLGRWLGRWPRRRVMLIANASGGSITLLLAWLLWQRLPAMALVLLLLALAAAAEATLVLCFSTLIPQLVPSPLLSRANGLFVSSEGLVLMGAPFLGAALVGLTGLPGVLVLDAASFLVAFLCVSLVRWPSRALAPADQLPGIGAPAVAGLRSGLRQLLAGGGSRPLLLLTTAVAFALAAIEVLFPAWVVASMGSARLSFSLAMGAAGYLAGLRAWSLVPRRRWIEALLTALSFQSVILIGAGLVVFEGLPWLWFGGLAVFSAGLPVSLAALESLWQQLIPPVEQPRLFAARYSLVWAARLGAFASAALLVDRILRPALGFAFWPGWLTESLGTGSGRPMAVAMGAVGWLLLITLAGQSAALKRLVGTDEKLGPCGL